jgi:hypothetical protein
LVELIFEKVPGTGCNFSMCDTADIPDTDVSGYGTSCCKLIACTSVLVLIHQPCYKSCLF